MIKSSEWVLKAILSRYPAEEREALEQFLSQEQLNRLNAMPSTASVQTESPEPPLIERIHWSWLIPALREATLKEQKFFLHSLPSSFQENLMRELKLRSLPTVRVTRTGQDFFLKQLIEYLTGETNPLLPVYFLPPSPIAALLHLEKQELIRLIDFLSLYDLALELKQIVETKILKKIYSFLSEEEKKFLKKEAAAFKEPSPTARLGLEKWDGAEQPFRVLLHKRGLVRLGAALCGQHPDFIWYVCHQLDIGRGTALMKFVEAEKSLSATGTFIKQVEEILKGFAA